MAVGVQGDVLGAGQVRPETDSAPRQGPAARRPLSAGRYSVTVALYWSEDVGRTMEGGRGFKSRYVTNTKIIFLRNVKI